MKRLLGAFLVGLAILSASACADDTKAEKHLNIAAVYVPGGLGGYPYNDAIHEALQRAQKDLKIEFENRIPKSNDEIEGILRELAGSKKYDAIVTLGFQTTKSLIAVAKEFPQQKFVGIEAGTDQEGTPHNLPNIASYTANYYEPMYAAGALAAMMTKTKTIGSVWSMDFKKYGSYIHAYTDGAKSINPEIKVLWECTGSYQEKPPKGKECAEKLIAQDADIIMNHTQAEHTGVIEAVKEHKVYLIGFHSESKLAPENTLFDINRHQAEDVYRTIHMLMADKFEAGTYYEGLVKRHYTIDFAKPPHPLVTSKAWEKLNEITDKFKSGELKRTWSADAPAADWKK